MTHKNSIMRSFSVIFFMLALVCLAAKSANGSVGSHFECVDCCLGQV